MRPGQGVGETWGQELEISGQVRPGQGWVGETWGQELEISGQVRPGQELEISG